LYICIIWFLISSLSLRDRSAHKLGKDVYIQLSPPDDEHNSA